MKKLLFAVLIVCLAVFAQTGAGKVAGTWQMAVETDHGNVSGPMELKQEGAKISGAFEAQGMGKIPVTGEAQGQKVVLTLAMHGGEMMLKLNGTLDGNKMAGVFEGIAGKWSASR